MKIQEVLRQPALIIDLLYMNEGKNLRVVDIAKKLKLWHGNAAKKLKKLENEGFILKTQRGRTKTINLTNKGRELGKLINSIKQELNI